MSKTPMAMLYTSSNWFSFASSLVVGFAILTLSSCHQSRNDSVASSGSATSSYEAGEIVHAPEIGNSVLRRQMHQKMTQSRLVSRRDAWDALAEGAAISNEFMMLFYTRRTILKSEKASGENQSQKDYWNREHLWPRSYGLKGTPADFDLYNLVPVDRTVNSSRGNKVFDLASGPHHECLPCRVSNHAWEPPDEVKGDIARVLFYMDVRYEGSQNSEIQTNEPDLSLDEVPDASAAKFGPLSVLLKWHCADEVSETERVRQETVFRFQGNRNLFVDDPGLVEGVYGVGCDAEVLTSTEALD